MQHCSVHMGADALISPARCHASLTTFLCGFTVNATLLGVHPALAACQGMLARTRNTCDRCQCMQWRAGRLGTGQHTYSFPLRS